MPYPCCGLSRVPLWRGGTSVHPRHFGTDSCALSAGYVDWVWVALTALLFFNHLCSWRLRTRLLFGSLLCSSLPHHLTDDDVCADVCHAVNKLWRSVCRNSLVRQREEQKQIENRSFFRCDPKLPVNAYII
jgi:hypothetical protein